MSKVGRRSSIVSRRIVKRSFDLVLAVIALVVLSPLFLFLTGMVWASLGRPIFFKQERAGKRGRVFVLYKYRTMKEVLDMHGRQLPDKDRLTWLGVFLRSFSLD